MSAASTYNELDELCRPLRRFRAKQKQTRFLEEPTTVDQRVCAPSPTSESTLERKCVKVGVPIVYHPLSGGPVQFDLCISEYWKVSDLVFALSRSTGIPPRFIHLTDIVKQRPLSIADYTSWRIVDTCERWELNLGVAAVPTISNDDMERLGKSWGTVLTSIAKNMAPPNKRLMNAGLETEYIIERLARNSASLLIDSFGHTLLHYALEDQDPFLRKMVKRTELRTEALVKRLAPHRDFMSAAINVQKPQSGDSALMMAVCYHSLPILEVLLDADSVDLDLKTEGGSTALSLAAALGKEEFVAELQNFKTK